MEILILIGIFAFTIAILFRSNEALDRVGAVEKEVKTLEQEVVQPEPHTEPLSQSSQTEVSHTTDPHEPVFVAVPVQPPQDAASPEPTFPDVGNVHMN